MPITRSLPNYGRLKRLWKTRSGENVLHGRSSRCASFQLQRSRISVRVLLFSVDGCTVYLQIWGATDAARHQDELKDR